ncbi:MAG: hypothetical protein IT236_06945 [Bacteroidia bacterium]|nr:hypothetical protein [Bacteroidia bacterium]
MDIKSKVEELLSKENYTFTQLAEYLHMTETGLEHELNNKTLELRNLEAISKALRVPLYGFFRAEGAKFDRSQKPYYINQLWTGEDNTKTKKQLQEEIELLKNIIALKEDQLKKLD